ncbi:hypothetical protein [Faecalibacter macacae]|uniref:Phage protein n=1 Tax=Faecalibacter macacae TaxID=1859289 RepID=A0A3L9MBL4_9FLAO|nr:hypothetical protein [Faecalibacter macacae]RLZ10450.1 hypothetical protein EAH69_06570 [Faecalibacter macacae]
MAEEKQYIEKEVNYKGHTKTFKVEVMPVPPFDPNYISEEAYERLKNDYIEEAKNRLADEKILWVFGIEQELQK